MGVAEFELVRFVHAPIDEVFARLADIEGHNEWMPTRGSILHHTEKTSPGPTAKGTTYLDKTLAGWMAGEVEEFEPPTTLLFHWWDRSKKGTLCAQGWPGYRLEATGERTTLVRHHARLETYGIYRMSTPVLHWMAVRERNVTLDALEASFGLAAR